MIFACAAAAAAVVTQNPVWVLGGAYHPPLANADNLLQAIEAAKANGGVPFDGEALTVALDVVQAWAVLLTLGFTLVIFVFLAFCVCSKKDDGYDEFEITPGITTVKICHDGGENGVSLIPQIGGSGTLVSLRATDDTSESSSRYTAKRELPAIPKQEKKSDRPDSQRSSDHYASVSDPLQGGSNLKLIGGVQVLPAGAIAPGGRAAVVKESILSPESKKTELRKDKSSSIDYKKGHQYSQVTKPEHAYAKVIERPDEKVKAVVIQDRRSAEIDGRYKSMQTEKIQEEKQTREKSAHKMPITAPLQTSTFNPPPAASSLRSPVSPQEPLVVTSPTRPESTIPAAMAISGRQRANEEMPYMTPPNLQNRDQQQNFSGDSQDSRGYTSISVREPLAALKARQAAERSAIKGVKNPSEGEGYYMTVSDDSADDTYACIYEGGSRKENGSETYAQIDPRPSPSSTQAPIQSPTNVPPSPTQLTRSQEQSPPAPPSVDSLRHVVHSRQASASSATSTGMGSPVADKRGTRSSPLPPLPQGDASLYSPPEPLIPLAQTVPKSPPKVPTQFVDKSGTQSIEEMYAKVNKKSSGHSRGSSATGIESDSTTELLGRWNASPNQEMSHSLVETRGHDSSMINRAKSCEVSWGNVGKKTIPENRMSGNYESIPSQSLYSESSDPGYETVKNVDPPYASVANSESYAGYETVRGSDMESEPGYETLKHKEPGYETVSEFTSKKSSHRINSDFEPRYETVANGGTSDPGYESVQEKGKDYDPGYEELSHPRTLSETDPNYEQLKFTSTTDHGYEEVRKQVVEGNYELVSNYETQEMPLAPKVFGDLDPIIPLYASVQKKKPEEKETTRDSINTLKDSKKDPMEDTLLDFLSGHTKAASNGVQEDIPNIPREFSLTQEMITPQTICSYPVMDSPEDVELPPPGEENAGCESPSSVLCQVFPDKKDITIASLTDTKPILDFGCETGLDARPMIPDLISSSPVKNDPTISSVAMSVSSGVDSKLKGNKRASPLPPSLDDFTASPPPPPPPLPSDDVNAIIDFSPPPPPLNGVCGEEASPIPPPLSCADDNITVTVNPMATDADSAHPDLCSQPSDESTANGSVESVVTVDSKTGTDPATAPAVLQQTTSASETKRTDEAITPV